MAAKISSATLGENLRFNRLHVIPYLSRGVFTESPYWVSFWARRQRDPLAVQFIGNLREKHQSDFIYVRMLAKKTLLVLERDAIRHILDASPQKYADPEPKRKGMSRFQPNALTISRGDDWRDRRVFNIGVLGDRSGSHPYLAHFLATVRKEAGDTLSGGAGNLLNWQDFAELFTRIALQIIFGQGEIDASAFEALKKMMRESNRMVFLGRKSKYFDDLYAHLNRHLEAPRDNSLVALCAQVPSSANTRIENQIPHWMFAMKDTLAINVVRALALIAAHPSAEQRVREEIDKSDLTSAASVANMKYLEACIQEAMRLWPTTLMLMRESLVDDRIGDIDISSKTQVMIHNGFNHRNPQAHDFADRFYPELWIGSEVNYHINHLSNGPQVCAGKSLALDIGKGVLATLLKNDRFALEQPALDPQRPLPHAYDHYRVKFKRNPAA